ncbi:MAG: TRAP transporter substrate-binding protein DctP [Victivallales bacterium]|jgi:TRAP-type C4-dicarboxylate transport system substrate-binding protein
MRTTTVKLFPAVLAFVFFLTLHPTLSAVEDVVLKMAGIVPEKSIWGQQFNAAADEIKKKTDGKVRLKIYYGGVQGDEISVVQKMRIGQLHGAGFMAYGLSRVCPDSLAFSIPLLFRNAEEAIWVREKMNEYFRKQAREKGFEIIGWTNQGFTYCFSKDKVVDLAALRNAKPWALEKDELCNALFKSASISAIPLSVGDVNTALQSGLIRTVFSPPTGMIVMQWHTRVNYRLDTGLFYSFGAIVITSDQWNKIPEERRETVRRIFQEHIVKLNAGIERQNNDALKVLDEKLKVIKPSEEALSEFRELTVKVEEEMTGKDFSSETMKVLKSHLEQYRRENQK